MGGMIAVVVLALLMVPVFFYVVQRAFGRKTSDDTEVHGETGTAKNAGASPQAAQA
jgi:hypothetical protein